MVVIAWFTLIVFSITFIYGIVQPELTIDKAIALIICVLPIMESAFIIWRL